MRNMYVLMYRCEEIDHNVTTTEQYSELTEEQQIKNRLSQIDLESIRPLWTKVSGARPLRKMTLRLPPWNRRLST